MAEFERELNWDDEISNETGDYEPLPEGDYQFTVSKIERARSQGKGKLPPCNMAKVTLTVHGAEYDRDITVNLVLHSSLEWKLSQFFLSIGLKKHGEPLRMNWTGAAGKTGNCHVTVREYTRSSPHRRIISRSSRRTPTPHRLSMPSPYSRSISSRLLAAGHRVTSNGAATVSAAGERQDFRGVVRRQRQDAPRPADRLRKNDSIRQSHRGLRETRRQSSYSRAPGRAS